MLSLASDMTAWCAEHMGQHDSPEFHQYLDTFTEMIHEKFSELKSEHTNKGRFGISDCGGCTRRGTFRVHPDYVPIAFDGDSQVTFHIGHLLECMGMSILKTMGYEIYGEQQEIEIEPFMLSYLDGMIKFGEEDLVLSMKSTGYKTSNYSARTGKSFKAGFAALPTSNLYGQQTSWWTQAQAEIYATGAPAALVVVVAKDVVRSLGNDPDMRRNGSLSFYTELVFPDEEYISQMLEAWEKAWAYAQRGEFSPPLYYVPGKGYVELPAPGHAEGWGGPNQRATGKFNPCFSCDWREHCIKELTDG